jgi:hypothetical protein
VAAAGVTVYAWCRANNVPSSRLYRWQQRLRLGSVSPSLSTIPQTRLVEVVAKPVMTELAVRNARPAHYIVAVNDVTITVGDDFADATVDAVPNPPDPADNRAC